MSFWDNLFRGPISPEPLIAQPQLPLSPVASLRPCEVDDKVCWFHRFVDEDKVLLKVKTFVHKIDAQEFRKSLDQAGIVPACCDTEVVRETRALIEWPDGSLSTVAVERVQFLDREGDPMG